jgi:hypothetical protein
VTHTEKGREREGENIKRDWFRGFLHTNIHANTQSFLNIEKGNSTFECLPLCPSVVRSGLSCKMGSPDFRLRYGGIGRTRRLLCTLPNK